MVVHSAAAPRDARAPPFSRLLLHNALLHPLHTYVPILHLHLMCSLHSSLSPSISPRLLSPLCAPLLPRISNILPGARVRRQLYLHSALSPVGWDIIIAGVCLRLVGSRASAGRVHSAFFLFLFGWITLLCFSLVRFWSGRAPRCSRRCANSFCLMWWSYPWIGRH